MDNSVPLSAFLQLDTYQRFYQDNRSLFIKIVLMVFIGGFLIHSFRAHQPFFSYDALVGLNFYDAEISYKLNSGRYLAFFNVFFRGHIAHPLVLTLLSFAWISFAVFFLAKLFHIRSNSLLVAIVSLFLTQKSYIFAQAALIHEVDIFMLALLMSVLSVYVACRFKLGYLMTPLLVCLVCTSYQAYLCYILTLASVALIYNILSKKSFDYNKQLAIKLFSSIAAGLLLYYLLVQFRLNVLSDSNVTIYNSPEQVTSFLNPDIVLILFSCIDLLVSEVLRPAAHNAQLTAVCNVILAALAFISAVVLCLKQKIKGGNLVLLLLGFFSLPFFLHVVTILSMGLSSSSMRCAFELMYVLSLLLIFHPSLKARWSNFARLSSMLLLAMIVFNSAIYANQLYLRIALDMDKTNMISNRIVYEIEHTPGYVANKTPVVFLGSFMDNESILALSGAQHLSREFPLVYPLNYEPMMAYAPAYFRQIMGYPINLQYLDDKKDTSFIKNMPVFPHVGYCQMHDGWLYVKISDTK